MESYFNAAARKRAGINVLEPLGPRMSVDRTTCPSDSVKHNDEAIHNDANLLSLILSILESKNNDDFKLQDGLRLPGIQIYLIMII